MSSRADDPPVPANLVFPDDVATNLLIQHGLSEPEAHALISQVCEERGFLSRIGFHTSLSTMTSIHVAPAVGKQGDFSYTAFVILKNAQEQKQLVAQFRAPEEPTNAEVLKEAVSIFGDYVAIPLCIVTDSKLQLTITHNYGDTYEQQSHTFTLDQKRGAIRSYANFLAMGCKQPNYAAPTNFSVANRLQEIASWNLGPAVLSMLQSLVKNLDVLSELPIVVQHRDHGPHNILYDKEGRITKVIDWGNKLSLEPMGYSFSRVEGFLGYFSWPTWAAFEGERELRKDFWDAFWTGVQNIPTFHSDLTQKVKVAKDIGFVIDSLERCSCGEDVDPYQLVRLEGVLSLSSGETDR